MQYARIRHSQRLAYVPAVHHRAVNSASNIAPSSASVALA